MTLAEQIEKQHSVENGKLIKVSVSSINKFRRCPREWHWRYVTHAPDKEPSKGIVIGKEGHGRLEHFYTTGQDVLGPLEKMAQERGHLPPYDPTTVFPEAEFDFMEGTVKVNGFIDIVWLRAIDIALLDWKFKSDIDAYAASAEDLIDPTTDEGVQMLGYVKAISTLPQRVGTTALVRHVNMQYKGRRDVFMAEKEIEVTEAIRRWDGMVGEVLPKMHVAAAVQDSLQVIGDETQCDKYGGCPYRARCFDPMTRFNKAMEAAQLVQPQEKKMGLLDDLFKKQQETAVPAAAVPAPVPDRKAQLLAELATIEQKQKADVEQPAAPKVVEETSKALPLVLPPDAPKSDPALAARVEEPVVEKPKRTRKAKIEAAAAEAFAQPVGTATAADIANAPFIPRRSAIHLYFVGSPVGVQTQDFMGYVRGLEKNILGILKIEHFTDVRLLSGNEYGFGKYKGLLSDHALKALPAPGHYIVGADERALIVAEALVPVILAAGGSVVR